MAAYNITNSLAVKCVVTVSVPLQCFVLIPHHMTPTQHNNLICLYFSVSMGIHRSGRLCCAEIGTSGMNKSLEFPHLCVSVLYCVDRHGPASCLSCIHSFLQHSSVCSIFIANIPSVVTRYH